MQHSITILKHPELDDSQDYELLRQKGLEYIQELGSSLWTDYNIHDPGITILELLSYAITDLGYRSSFDVKDLLAVKMNELPDPGRQAFFTARDILTVNPWTNADFRKLLIDVDGIKNAWLTCKQCPCDDLYLYANCAKSILQYEPTEHRIIIKGMYDVLLEFEDEEGVGDLNSGKIKYNFSFFNGTAFTTAAIEMRLPSWQQLENDKEIYKLLRQASSAVKKVTVQFISANKEDNTNIPAVPDRVLDNALRKPIYATMAVEFYPDKNLPATTLLQFADIPLTVWFRSDADRKALVLNDLVTVIEDVTASAIFPKYLDKIHKADEVIAITKQSLHSHRNLCEDYCSIKAIEVEDVAVCADIELEPSVDIEAVLAEAYYLIDQYFSPDIKFYSLQQLLEAGKPVDEIFEGPALNNGFIDNDQLDSTNLKRTLHVSDIINLLMDIPGVKAIRDLSLARYDDDGNYVATYPWTMDVSFQHQPRLYTEASKFLVFKNGLPFLPDALELSDTLQVIKGQNAQPKFSVLENDLPVPVGTYYDMGEYFPLQYSLPLTYGVGHDGLPSTASDTRKAQAKQLKGYLLFYEQLLVNYLEQLAHVKELFAVDDNVTHTYFSRLLSGTEITAVGDIYNGLTTAVLESLDENETIFLDRRNRFLDHLLSRFAEQFNDYALMLYSFTGNKTVADNILVSDKIAFIKDIPFMSSNRARAFDYKDPATVCSNENIAGLKTRIMRLLGISEFAGYFKIIEEKDSNDKLLGRRWQFVNETGHVYLQGTTLFTEILLYEAEAAIAEEIIEVRKLINDISKYQIFQNVKWGFRLLDTSAAVIAEQQPSFDTQLLAEAERDALIDFAGDVFEAEKIFVVEHLLLRPRNKAGAMFQLYEEKDIDGVFFERRWRLIDSSKHIYLSGSTRYSDPLLANAEEKAKQEIAVVCKYITDASRYNIRKEIKWVLNLTDETGEVIATRKQHFVSKEAAEAARDEIIAFAKQFSFDTTNFLEGGKTGDVIAVADPLLSICIPPDCSLCGDEDPYSFRLTIIMNGETGIANSGIEFRRFAEQTIRTEVPAHLGVKICWVKSDVLDEFEKRYCSWLQELAKPEPDAMELHNRLVILLELFEQLKSVYPAATLHDCVDGDDSNRVYLDQTII